MNPIIMNPFFTKRYPSPVTAGLVFACVCVHILLLVLPFGIQVRIYHDLSLDRVDFLGQRSFSVFSLFSLFTPVSSFFLHANWLHLVSNMLFLAYLGHRIEPFFGKGIRFLFFCIVVVYVAGIFHILSSLSPAIGASGGASGILGAYAVLFSRTKFPALPFARKLISALWVKKISLIFVWTVLQLFLGFFIDIPIAVFAHIGGFAAGVLLVSFFVPGKIMQRISAIQNI